MAVATRLVGVEGAVVSPPLEVVPEALADWADHRPKRVAPPVLDLLDLDDAEDVGWDAMWRRAKSRISLADGRLCHRNNQPVDRSRTLPMDTHPHADEI